MEELTTADPAALDERVPPAEIDRLAALLQRVPVITELLDAMPDFYMILNRTRQIVFANRSLRRMLEPQGRHCAVGLRPGEVLACSNSAGGCGLSERCLDCGSFKAILASQRNTPAVEECRMNRGGCREALDLRAFTTPLRFQGESFVVVAAVDIGSEKRRESLERCFMHDVANTVSGILCAAELLRNGLNGEAQEAAEAVRRGSRHLLEEVRSQRDLLAAEDGDLVVQQAPFPARALLEDVVSFYQRQRWIQGRDIRIVEGTPGPALVNDRALVGRVVGNMLKNALEASGPGDTVTLGCHFRGGQAEFTVHNPQVMLPEVQRQVFQRSFSTKGKGRGLGTYGMKLLAERYLRGRVGFESSPEMGTTFRVSFPRLPT